MSKTNRREFLINNAPLIAAPLLLPMLSDQIVASPLHDLMNRPSSLSFARYENQGNWRYCDKCSAIFYNGQSDKGRCAAGGGHNAQGFNFLLQYGGDLLETPKAQIGWRYCDKCFVLFYDGSPDKGRCAAGGGHNAQGFLFRLLHDINVDSKNQGGWRYCSSCRSLFYDGYSNKGNCPAGGGHTAQGYLFVLDHGPQPDIHLRSDLRTDGWAPIGGWVDITATRNGDYVFSGHMHNSGGLNIKYTLGVLLTTPDGQTFGFAIDNHQVDGTQTIINRKRDDDWKVAANSPRIAENWNQVTQSTLHWRLVASDTITAGIEGFMKDIVSEVCPRTRNPKFVPCWDVFYPIVYCTTKGC